MILHGLTIQGVTIEAEDFGSDKCLNLINTELGHGKITSKSGKGLSEIFSYIPGTHLDNDQQVTIALVVVSMNAKAIIEGDVTISNIEIMTPEEKQALENFSISMNEYLKRAKEILEGNDNEPQLIHSIKGSPFGIFCIIEDGKLLYYIADIKHPGNNQYGYIVTENGISFDELDENDFAYCLIQRPHGLEIWSGTPSKGFEIDITLKNYTANDVTILKKGFVAYVKDDIFYIRDISDDREIFMRSSSEISGETELGNTVDIYTLGNKNIFIYTGEDSTGNEVYYVINEDGEKLFISYPYPYPILTPTGDYIVLYDNDSNRYNIANGVDGILCKTVVAFYDEKGNYFFGGNFPPYILEPKGKCELYFMYERMNEDGKKEIIEGMVLSGIERDVSQENIKKIPDIINYDFPTEADQ